jgi:hypothetical protein
MHRTLIVAVIAAAMLRPAAAPAQLDQTSRTPVGPRVDATALSPRPVSSPALLSTTTSSLNAARAARPLRRSEILMIVGGAMILTGALIGDDAGTVIMIGGAGVGLYGLYLFLQQQKASDGRPAVGIGYSHHLRT